MAEKESSPVEDVEERDVGYLNNVLLAAVVLGVLLVILAFFFFRERLFQITAIFIGLIVGILTAYYYYGLFSAEDKELVLGDGEKVLVETSNPRSFISVPKVQGGFEAAGPPIRVNLFLTNKAIIAEPLDYQDFNEEGQPYFFHVNHSTITRLSHESRFMSDYIRVTFIGLNSQENDVLIFAGEDTGKWVGELNKILKFKTV